MRKNQRKMRHDSKITDDLKITVKMT